MSSNWKDNKLNSSWHSLDVETVYEKLETKAEGLTNQEAEKRIAEVGLNKLPEPLKKGFFRRFLIHFHNVLIYVLIAAAIITALMGHWIDTWVIMAVVVINGIIGYLQENKAEKALESIKHMLSLKATVVREGRRKEIAAEQLVPGDIVMLSMGDKVPADIRVIEASNCQIEEAALTGESDAVSKKMVAVYEEASLGDRKSMCYSSTSVRAGTAKGIVVATGSATELGKINTMISETEELTTPLIQKINNFGKWLSVIIVGLAGGFFAFGFFFRDYELSDLFLAVIGLAVAAIPEGLPAILTITLAIGVQRMARRNAIIRRLPSVETLGSVTVICSDKTGTLTRNEMTAKAIYTSNGTYHVEGSGYKPEGEITKDNHPADWKEDLLLNKLLKAVYLCNNAEVNQDQQGEWTMEGTPTEGALITLALKAGLKEMKAGRIDSIPFDSDYKYMATLHQFEEETIIYAKGAPDRLLDLCSKQFSSDGEQELDIPFWEEQIKSAAKKGQRLLGAAFRKTSDSHVKLEHEDLKQELVFIGLIGIMDPPRPEAIQAIKQCKEAGIRVKMITGDHMLTAMTIGHEMGIGDGEKALSGSELEKMSDEQLRNEVKECDIYARTSPEHKLRIVKALQFNGEICAMTGDGVNDAPSLKQANMGIAMGIKGTEVTKESASMVLADDNFASIVSAVEEGRTIYDNLRKTLLFLLPTNGAEALVIIVAILLGITMPITPVQILWVNMVTAVTLALALSFEPMEDNTMKRPPRNNKESMISLYFLWRIGFVSMIIGGLTFAVYLLLQEAGFSLEVSRTAATNTLVIGQMAYLFNCRKIHESVLGKGFFTNKIVFLVSTILIILQLLFTYVPFMNVLFETGPMKFSLWIYPVIAGIVVFLAVELEKKLWR